MAFNLQSIIRPHIWNLTPYSSARDEYSGTEGIFLDANENPLGSAGARDFNRYPDPYQKAIKAKISNWLNVSAEQIFLGNGSDEPIDLLIRSTCKPEVHNIITLPPTYGMYEVSANINQTELIKIPLSEDFQIRTEEVLGAVNDLTRIIWVCSPNNPTGNLVSAESITRILENFEGLVVVDEAYIDFADSPSWIASLGKYPNLVVLRTFSKSWGLAGLRTGMAIASPELIRILNKIKAPYNISTPAQEMLLEALDNWDNTRKMVTEILKERERLHTMLLDLSFVKMIHPSDANFLLVKFEDPVEVMKFLTDEKIIVRDRSKVTLCEGCLRVSVGTTEENDALVHSLQRLEK